MKKAHLRIALTLTGLFERVLATDIARAQRLMIGTVAFFLALFIIPGLLGIRWNVSPSLPIGIYIESADDSALVSPGVRHAGALEPLNLPCPPIERTSYYGLTMSLIYAKEKLGLAVRTLATGTEDLHGRLIDAAISSLIHVPIESLPSELKSRFEILMKSLTHGDGASDRILTSVRKMSEKDVSRLAGEIVDVNEVLAWAYGEERAKLQHG